MYIVYFDEVKYDPPTQRHHWIAGLAVHESAIQGLETELNQVAYRAFGSSALKQENEIHASDMLQGKHNFKHLTLDDRLSLFAALCDINKCAYEAAEIERIYAQVAPDHYVVPGKSYRQDAFMLFVEQTESFLETSRDLGLLIGDFDEETFVQAIEDQEHFKAAGTSYARGREIMRLVDCVHFVRSHHSRLVQLADHFVWCIQLIHGAVYDETKPRGRFRKTAKQRGLHRAPYHKTWPPLWDWH